jgi:uncharacterized protein DUF6777
VGYSPWPLGGIRIFSPGRLERPAATGLLVAAATLVIAAAGCGSNAVKGTSERPNAHLQTIRFQKPTDPGPNPFTAPADVAGPKTVSLPASGPFGGTGSNQVCDRDLLIRFLKAHPDRMRAWAEVEGIDPSENSVSRYIAKLHPVTLTRDTQVTNHTFINGHAVGFQSILQAGTAVLVDKYGRPVARCRCGNPLTEPTYYKQATCYDCPPHYTPPTDYCRFWFHLTDYDHNTYTNSYYSNKDYDKTYIVWWKTSPWIKCYEAYPDPPPVTLFELFKRPQQQQSAPSTYNPPSYTPPSNSPSQPTQPYPGTTGGGTTGGRTTGGGTTGGGTTGGGTTGGGSTGGGTTGGGTTGGGSTGSGSTGGDTTGGGTTGGGTTGGGP